MKYISPLLRKYCRPLMTWYYMRFYKAETYIFLSKFMSEKQNFAISIVDIAKENNWSQKHSLHIFNICNYCKLIKQKL